jgi:hypothetical protein
MEAMARAAALKRQSAHAGTLCFVGPPSPSLGPGGGRGEHVVSPARAATSSARLVRASSRASSAPRCSTHHARASAVTGGTGCRHDSLAEPLLLLLGIL